MPCFLFPFSLFIFLETPFFFLPISCQQSIFTRVASLVGALYLPRRENLTDHLQGDGKTFCSRKSLQRGKMNCSSTCSSAGGRETGNCFHWHSFPQSFTHPRAPIIKEVQHGARCVWFDLWCENRKREGDWVHPWRSLDDEWRTTNSSNRFVWKPYAAQATSNLNDDARFM